MKKMTYLMMLVLGLTAVNGVNADRPTAQDRIANTKKMIKDAKAAPKGKKVKSLIDSAKAAIKRNKDDINDLVKKGEAAIGAVGKAVAAA